MKQLFLIVFIFSSFYSYSQKNNFELEKAQAQIDRYSDLYFKFSINNKAEIKDLPKFISIDHKTKHSNNEVYAYVPKPRFDDLLALGIPFEVVAKTKGTEALTMATTLAEMDNWDRYPTHSVYQQMMEEFAANYPAICRLETIGTSQQGREIKVLKITNNPDIDENEPEFFYSGQMHGDELVGSIMLLRLIDYLLENYGTNSQVDNIINNIEIWINPLANPDGLYQGGNETVSGASRYFSNWVDPNRNFPAPGNEHPDGEGWTVETIDMMNFIDAHNFVLSSNLHSGAEVVNYPWDMWESSVNTHADDDWWRFVSLEYVDTVFNNSPGGYFTGVSNNGIIEGGDWYVVWGGRQDYITALKHGREFTLELSDWKSLDSSELPDHWNYNYKSLLLYMEQSLYGIGGIITDAITGEPLEAKVEIDGHDDDNSFVYSTMPVGNYHRLIFEGNFDVSYSKEGYISQTINLDVSNHSTIVQDVALHKILSGQEEVDLFNAVTIVPNPTNGDTTKITFSTNLDYAELTLYDSLGRKVHSLIVKNINSGGVINLPKMSRLQDGMYLLEIKTQNRSITKKIIKI